MNVETDLQKATVQSVGYPDPTEVVKSSLIEPPKEGIESVTQKRPDPQ